MPLQKIITCHWPEKIFKQKQLTADLGVYRTIGPVADIAKDGFRILQDLRPLPLHLRKNVLQQVQFHKAAAYNYLGSRAI